MGKGCTMLRKLEVKSCQREPLPCERPQESSLQRNGSGRSLLTSQRQEHPPDATRHRLDIGPRNPTGSHVRSAHCRVCWGQKGSLAWKLRSDRPAGHMPSLLVGDCQVKHPKDLPLESAHSNAAGEAAASRHQSTGVPARAGSSNDAGHQRSQKPSSRVMDNDCSTPGKRAAPVVAPDKKASESWCAFWQRWQKLCKGSEYSKAACLSEWKSLPEIARDEFKAAHGFK